MNREKVCSVCSFESSSTHKTCNNTVDGKRCGGVWNETVKPEAVTQLIIDSIDEQTQHVVVDNIADCVRGAEAVITIVGYPKDVEEVYLAPGGILETAVAASSGELAAQLEAIAVNIRSRSGPAGRDWSQS